MLRAIIIDSFSFMFVDGIFKQLLKSVLNDNVAEKKSIWKKETYVLSFITTLYFCFDHTPYLLFFMTSLTYLFTQYSWPSENDGCNNCLNENICSCKIPGNVSFRSPLARNTGVRNRHRASSIPNSLIFDRDISSRSTPKISKNQDSYDRNVTPFDSFKRYNFTATSTPFNRRSSSGLPQENETSPLKLKLVHYLTVLHYFLEKVVLLLYGLLLLYLVKLRRILENWLYPPLVEKKVSSQTQATISAIKSSLLLISATKFDSDFLHNKIANNNNESGSDKNEQFREVLKITLGKVFTAMESSDRQQNLSKIMSEMFNCSNFSRQFTLQFLFNTLQTSLNFDKVGDETKVQLQVPFDSLLKQILAKVAVSTRKNLCDNDYTWKQSRVELESVARQCWQDMEQCEDGIFSADYYFILGKLSMAQWMLEQAKQCGTSVVLSNFEGQQAETMFCSSCDSFAYNFNKFCVLDLDILVAPTNQARRITTIEDCLHYLSSKRKVKKTRNFQCVCYDEFIQHHCPPAEKETSILSEGNLVEPASSPRQVSFADENCDEVYSGSGDGKLNSNSNEKSPKHFSSFTHYSKRLFAQLPPYLILNLNRFAPDERTGRIVKTVNQLMINKNNLDLYPITVASQSKQGYPGLDVDPDEYKYSLCFLVAHSGFSYYDGDYITYMKIPTSRSPSDNGSEWLKVSSEGAQSINIVAEVGSKFVKENAVVVVYEKIK